MPRILISLLVVAALIFPAFPLSAAPEEIRLSGIERHERAASDPLRATASALMWLPRNLLNLSLYGNEKAAAAVTDPDFIDWAKEVLYLYKRDLAWFPLFDYASGFRPVYGAGLYYTHEGWRSLTRVMAHDAEYWQMDTKFSYSNYIDRLFWKASVGGLIERKDDYRFHGIGGDPRKDPRNRYIGVTDQEYGTYTEERKRLEWNLEVKPRESWGFRYTGYYQRRGFDDTGKGDNPLRDVFDLRQVPGFTDGAPIEDIYNEIALEIDSRRNRQMLSPGWKLDLYTGFSAGLDENPSDLLRFGGDAAVFIPTVREDRLIVPRVVLDMVEDTNGEGIPFTEYPRQTAFRGVSSRELVRSDRVSVTPSIEYAWPISHMFSGHLFLDYLAVGKSLSKIQWDDGLWATGVGVHFHYADTEFGRIELAGGSEGFQLSVRFGAPMRNIRR